LTQGQASLATRAFELLKQQQAEAALVAAQQLVAEAPKSPDAQHVLALCLAASGSSTMADAAFAAALALAPRQPAILANQARFLKRTGRLAEAIGAWELATKAAPRDFSAWFELGLAALELGRTAVALRAMREATRIDPGQSRAWHGLGSVLRAEGDLDEAENAFRRGLSLDEKSPSLWAALAGVLRLLGRPEEAEAAYRIRLRIGPLAPEILDACIGTLIDSLRIDEARARALELVEQYPGFTAGHLTLAHLLWEFGGARAQSADPAGGFITAAEARPDDRDFQLALIGFLLSAKRADEALERLQRLRQSADSPLLITLQANALELANRSDEAAAHYAQADRMLGGSDVNFNNAYVRHLLKAGQWAQAADRAERALAIEPQNQETWAYLATAWRLLEDPREDWLCGYDRLVELMPVDTPPGYASMAAFLTELSEALLPLHLAKREPVVQSLRGGSQTPGRLFGRPHPQIAQLQAVLRQTIERWIDQLPRDAGHPFLSRTQRSVRFTGSWSVRLWQSGSHANHFHSDGWMSSAFYVALPPTVRQPAASASSPGCLQLGQPPEELGLGLSPRRILQPEEGHLALFPSYLWHGTTPFDDLEPRLTVAFDMQPKV
jgi:tetratricopeptide (TPR) repeat protein